MIGRYRDIILAFVAVLAGVCIWSFYPLDKKLNLGLDLQGGMHLILEVDKSKLPEGTTVQDAVERAIEIIRNRVDAIGVAEPTIQKQGEAWIVVQLPGIKEFQKALDLIGQTALLEFKLTTDKPVDKFLDKDGNVDPAKLPKDLEVLMGKQKGEKFVLEKAQLLTGSSLATASVTTGEMADPVVAFEMTPEGAKTFGELTGRYVGRNLAIILDGKVYSAPVIRSRIGGGHGVIEGRFTWEEARNLALVLRAGALPAPVTIINKEVVGPSLGRDSIDRGGKAAVVGIILVALFMAAYYRLSGLIADVAMLANLVYLLGVMVWLKATITLPGIAGVALTMGMSVDSNVLILERIREEMRAGKTIRLAIESGYDRALLAIIDSHVTTLITAAILFFLGSGPIKGFAVTLFWGVAISLFTAVVITRAIFEMRKQYSTLSI